MTISFGTSVSINNLLALKSFKTYLNNYQQHEMPRGKRPSFLVRLIERWCIALLIKSSELSTRQRFIIQFAKQMVENKAFNTMMELMQDTDTLKASVSLNDVQPGMFAILYMVQNPQTVSEIKTGKELFDAISQYELEFALVKNPRPSISHEPRS